MSWSTVCGRCSPARSVSRPHRRDERAERNDDDRHELYSGLARRDPERYPAGGIAGSTHAPRGGAGHVGGGRRVTPRAAPAEVREPAGGGGFQDPRRLQPDDPAGRRGRCAWRDHLLIGQPRTGRCVGRARAGVPGRRRDAHDRAARQDRRRTAIRGGGRLRRDELRRATDPGRDRGRPARPDDRAALRRSADHRGAGHDGVGDSRAVSHGRDDRGPDRRRRSAVRCRGGGQADAAVGASHRGSSPPVPRG